MIYFVLAIIISYLLGSIPMGLLLTKLMGKGDLRKVGSGNIGATNVMRVGGLRMAGLVWLLDMFKAIVAVFIGYWVGDVAFGAWCGFAAIVGHCYPVWLKFRGRIFTADQCKKWRPSRVFGRGHFGRERNSDRSRSKKHNFRKKFKKAYGRGKHDQDHDGTRRCRAASA